MRVDGFETRVASDPACQRIGGAYAQLRFKRFAGVPMKRGRDIGPSPSTKKTHAVTMYDLADAKYYSNGWRAVSYSQADMTNSLRK